MKESSISSKICTHCGQDIDLSQIISKPSGDFCCYGCEVVYDLMQNKRDIISIPKPSLLNSYKYLDEESIRKKIILFEEEQIARVKIKLPAIHCSSCVYLLENLAEIQDGILDVQVHFSRKEASISFRSDKIELSQIAALLDHIGYTPDFQSDGTVANKSRNELLIQIGIAGFFFGNTMLLALPEYLDSQMAQDKDLQTFFHYLMLLFSIPVLLYSSKDYYKTALKSLRAGIMSIDLPIALGISVLFIRSTIEVVTGAGAGYFDSLTGLVFFLLLGKWYQQMTYQNFSFDRDLKSFLPLASNIIDSLGQEKTTSIDLLKEGDHIILRQGEILAADAILWKEPANFDYSYISGESASIPKKPGDLVYAGAKAGSGASELIVSKAVDQSYLSSLWSKLDKKASQKKGAAFTDRFSQYFTPAIIILAISGALFWMFIDSSKSLNVFTSVLIVACPCALALAEPFANGSLMRWFGRHGFYLKSSDVLNNISQIDSIVFDKTGTLTQSDKIKVSWTGTKLSEEEIEAMGSLAFNAQHPLAKALLQFLDLNPPFQSLVEFHEASGEGLYASFKENEYRLGTAKFLNLVDEGKTTSVYFEKNGVSLGYLSFYQELRFGLKKAIGYLNEDYNLSLLSGDNSAEEERFRAIFPEGSRLVFNQNPHEKLDFIEHLQNQSNKVLMIGDGLNDAGALQRSNVGLSLCEEKVNYFPASDALLKANSFDKLGIFLSLSRTNKKIIHAAFGLSLLYNAIGLSFALSGLLNPLVAAILMPISSASVVIFTTTANAFLVKSRMK